MPNPIHVAGDQVDLSGRIQSTQTVGASPSAASETIIGTLTTTGDFVIASGVFLEGWAAFTVGTSGVSGNLRIRQTNVSGSVIAASGAITMAATNLVQVSVQGKDTSPTFPGQVYVLTLTIASGAATSTVSALQLLAFIV